MKSWLSPFVRVSSDEEILTSRKANLYGILSLECERCHEDQ